MPAEKFTKKANTPKKSRQWQHVYESEKARGVSKGEAIKRASGVLKKESHTTKKAAPRKK
jgi:hypothetical protein